MDVIGAEQELRIYERRMVQMENEGGAQGWKKAAWGQGWGQVLTDSESPFEAETC